MEEFGMSRRLRDIFLMGAMSLGVAFSATGCDKKAPAAPFLDLLPTQTAANELNIEGTAEPESSVAITRTPAFAGTEAPASVVADPYTGRFRFTAPLSAGVENTFSVTSTDSSKNANVSEAATATVLQLQAYPAVVRLDLAPATVSADEGSVAVAVELIGPNRDISMVGQEVTVAVQNYAGSVSSLTLTADEGGFAQGLMTGFSVAGSAELVATAAIAAPDGTASSATRVLKVTPGLPASADIQLSAVVGGAIVGPATDITVPAGTEVMATVVVSDAEGNVLPAPAVQLSTDSPGVLVVAGTRLVGLRRAGAWNVFLQAGGVTVTGQAKITVEPNPAAGIVVVLSDNRVVSGEKVMVQVLDAYGNLVNSGDLALDIDGTPVASHPDASFANGELTFSAAGLYNLTAVLSADASISDSAQILVEDLVDTRSPEPMIDQILYPTSSLVSPRGRIEVQLTITDDRALADAVLHAQFGGVPACSSNSGTLFLNGQKQVTTAASVRVPNCAAPLDSVAFIVEARDQAGNIGFSAINDSLSIAVPANFDITAGTPYSANIVGWGDRIRTGDGPIDVAMDASSETAYISLSQNNRIVLVFPDRTQDDLRDLNRNPINFQQPEGLALDSMSNLLVGDRIGGGGNGQIDLVDPLLVTTRGQINNGARPARMSIDEQGAVPLFCAAFPAIDEVNCWADYASNNPVLLLTLGPADGLVAPESVVVDAGTLSIVEQNCTVKQTQLTYDAITPSVIAGAVTTITPVGPANFNGPCQDIAALPSGDVAVADNGGGQVIRVNPAGDTTIIAQGMPNVRGLDSKNGALFILDAQMQAVFRITGAL